MVQLICYVNGPMQHKLLTFLDSQDLFKADKSCSIVNLDKSPIDNLL